MSLRVRSDKPLICLDRNFRWRLPRQLGTGMEGAKTRRGEETAQDPRAKTLIQLWFQAAAYRTGPGTGRAKSRLGALHGWPRSDRAVRSGRRPFEKAVQRGSCCSGGLRWSGAPDRPRFSACCGHEAERLEIAEPTGECILDQTRRQRRCLAPATKPDQCKGLWLGLGCARRSWRGPAGGSPVQVRGSARL